METQYDHNKHEGQMYSLWEKKKVFTPLASAKKAFSIIMPPPNANDPLHIGHAMFITIEDVLTRYHRMKGEAALWLPGTDHAGIETQFVFEKKLAKEGKSRFDFDRDSLYKMLWDYVKDNSGVAVNQMKRLGASADWDRYKFTLDGDVVDFVNETFIRLFNDGLIYKGERLVNFCTKCGTGYSDLEVLYKEEKTKLYFIKYGPLVLATTRPETKFADTAVAVHPKDKRYKKYIGSEIEVKGILGNFKLNVISDDFVDPKFGTGVVKITPYHDFEDYDVWQRHKDEMPKPMQVIGLDGKLTSIAGKYAGLKVNPARELIEKDLDLEGLLEKPSEDYLHNVGTCYRCGTILEPLPLPQFFIKVNDKNDSLVKKVIDVLDKKETKVLGAGREKILRSWLNNLKDWNISRRIVWGIRIPVWYDAEKYFDRISISFLDKDRKHHQGTIKEMLEEGFDLNEIKNNLQQLVVPVIEDESIPMRVQTDEPKEPGVWLRETDTFDTWFSSGQWPVVSLKTNKKGDFEKFYPTTVMETGYDILPFWVMRMMLLGVYLTGDTPFKTVYLHGLIRDEQGRKMSKSIGNVINPLDMVEKYGADALRMALVMSSTPGMDKNVGETQIRGMRNFSNKIWNAARFVLLQTESPVKNGSKDLEYLKKLKGYTEDVTNNLDSYKIGLAAEKAYNYFWHWFCDECIEDSKKGKISTELMVEGIKTFLIILHPFAPFVTEAVWQQNTKIFGTPLLATQLWPNKV